MRVRVMGPLLLSAALLVSVVGLAHPRAPPAVANCSGAGGTMVATRD